MRKRGRKNLIGFINSRSKGGELRQQKHGPIVQASKIDNDLAQMEIGFMLAAACDSREMLRRVEQWADNTDGTVVNLTAHENRLLDPFWEWAIEAGYLEPPIGKLDPIEHMESEDLNERVKWRTARLLQRVSG